MEEIRGILKEGIVIPAHPLALDKNRKLDEKRQRGLTEYYLNAGAGGVAIGVHTTQFEIHNEKVGFLKPVLEMGAEVIGDFEKEHKKKIVKIAGVCGDTNQALREAELAVEMGYDAGLLKLGSFQGKGIDEIINHCKKVSEIIPVFGFYLNPEIGGIELPFEFWCKFLEIENIAAIKVAPFDRYKTLDVIRAISETGRFDVSLYTGNDDSIISDLISIYKTETAEIKFSGGLLGHWAFWTKKAVEYFEEIKKIMKNKEPVSPKILKLAMEVTDVNSAVFDAKNNFSGCIPGINYMLVKRGLLEGEWCIDPSVSLSPWQKGEIDRVWESYPHLRDDDFIHGNIERWLNC